ncbi:MAG: PfkB family carbohydrate kinase [Puniceicoccales bacterium]|jgi:D-beta-D-heptose 7-phosphate kinase/D-beta-D-heptose 1-phosphate adenosyltransferase|nr:PfkB family carbohydrate kinase [Puniceicoccales bacterium]
MALENLLERIRKLKILVIGDLMLDRYIFGDVSRISPEAPVPIVDVEQEKETLGAAANVALNLRSVGVDVEVLGIFGFDMPGEHLKHLLVNHAIKFDPSCQQKNVRTILKTRIVVRNQQLCRLDIEDFPEKYALEQSIYLEKLLAKINRYDGVIFSNYAKGTITQPIVDRIIAAAQYHRIITVADPKPKSGIRFTGIDLLKPNKSEALEMVGRKDCHGYFNAIDVCRSIFVKHQPRYLVITLGQEGMLIAKNGEIIEQIASDAREIFDVSGAGDTAIAFLTAALAARESIVTAAKLANFAAGIVVGKIGTATVTTEEILKAATFSCPPAAKPRAGV